MDFATHILRTLQKGRKENMQDGSVFDRIDVSFKIFVSVRSKAFLRPLALASQIGLKTDPYFVGCYSSMEFGAYLLGSLDYYAWRQARNCHWICERLLQFQISRLKLQSVVEYAGGTAHKGCHADWILRHTYHLDAISLII